jgi:hypothetical protein
VSSHEIFYQQGTPWNSHILKNTGIKPFLHGKAIQSLGVANWISAGLLKQL